MKLNSKLESVRVSTRPEGLRPYRYYFEVPVPAQSVRFYFEVAAPAQAVRFCTTATNPHEQEQG